MRINRYGAEEILRKLKQADVLVSQGKTVPAVCKELGVSDTTYYKWRKQLARMSD